MKKYNLSKPTEYEKNGEKKTRWNNVGVLTIFEKGAIVEIPAIGLEAKVFPIKVEGHNAEDITPEDIPF